MSENPTEREILWREYALNADLYKFYMDICIKSNIFYFGIVGGMVSFILTKNQYPMAKYALALPVVMSLFFAVISWYSSILVVGLRNDSYSIGEKLRMAQSSWWPSQVSHSVQDSLLPLSFQT